MVADRRKDKITTKCGLMFNPQRKTGRLEITLRDDGVTCPTCRGEK